MLVSSLEDSCAHGSGKYFALCALGGVISCGTTHTALVPLDLVKCRIQVNPEKYGGIIKGFKVTLKEASFRELGKGWAPTFFGYSMQGLGKFGFYEVFKVYYSGIIGEVSEEVFNLHESDNILSCCDAPSSGCFFKRSGNFFCVVCKSDDITDCVAPIKAATHKVCK